MMKKYIFVILSFFCYLQSIDAQNFDCEMYNKALTQLNKKWEESTKKINTHMRRYYYIKKVKLNFKEVYLESCDFKTFKDHPLKWEDLKFSLLKSDSVNCHFCHSLNYEKNASSFSLFEDTIIPLDTTKYIPVEVRFSQVLYKDNQYALFLILLKFKHFTASYRFLFEKENVNWELKEELVDTD